ncbi:MAG: MBG domain-containing protein, partial [Clostridia bacterium]
MNRTIKKTAMALVIVSLIALLTLSAIFLGALQVGNNTNDNIAAANDNPIEIGNYANVNGYVTTQSTVGTPISTVQELWNFFTSTAVTDTINNKVAGYLANDITISDNAIFLSGNSGDGLTTRNCRQTLHLPTNMVLDGNGHKIILNNSSDNMGTGYSNLKPEKWTTLGWAEAVVVQGGLAAWNSGVVKNVNFVINNNEIEIIANQYGASIVYGGVFGINDGTIDNCSLTWNGAKRFNLYTKAKSSGDTNLASVAVGGMVGIMGGGGKITNTKLDMQKSLILVSGVAPKSEGINNARARGYVGGMVGWMSNASITNATIVGSGDVLSSAVSGGYRTGTAGAYKYDYASYAGGLVGSSGQNGRMVGSGVLGTISGVVSSWTGKTQGTFGGDSDLHKYKPQMDNEWSTELIEGAADSKGDWCIRYANGNVLFGAVGDAGAQLDDGRGAATGISDINFLNITAPKYIASWNCTIGGAGGSRTPITSNALTVTVPATGNLFVGYPVDAKSNLTISYDAPFVDVNNDKIDDFNTFVWSGEFSQTIGTTVTTLNKKNFEEAKSIADYTLAGKSMTNVTHEYERSISSATITAKFLNGRGAYIGKVSGTGFTQVGASNIYNHTQTTYSKTALVLPTVELCYDIAKTRKLPVTDASLWTSYRGEEIANRVPIANAINAGTWTSEVLQKVAQRPEHILFESTIDGYNYIAYKGDNANTPKVKQTIAPKAVNATYNINPSDFTYKGAANTYTATVASADLIGGDTADVQFSFFELSGEATALTETKVTEAKNAGKYRIKMSGLSNGNYALAADKATDFVISPSTVVVTELNTNLTYNGLSQTPKVDIAYDIGAADVAGSNIKVRGIFPVDIGTTCDTVGLKDPSDNTQKNAGQFYLNLAIASGIAQRNYVPLTDIQKKTLFTIERAACTINALDSQTSEYLGSEVYIQYTISGVNGEDLTTLSDVLYERQVDDTTWAPDQPAFAQTYRATISIVGGKGQLAPNYKTNSKVVTFVINPRNATIEYDATLAASVPYNGTNYDYGKTTLGNIFQNGQDNVACKVYGYQYSKLNTATNLYENVKYDKITDLTTPKGVKAVGKYKVTANFNGYGNYIIAEKDKVKEFEITVANVNIEAKPVAREFGAPNPDMSAEWTYQAGSLQFFADDAVTLTLATSALQYSNVGTYPITLGAVNGPNAANYNVVLTANTAFTVNARQAKFDFTIDGMDALNKVIYNGKTAAVKPVITYPSAGYVEDSATK